MNKKLVAAAIGAALAAPAAYADATVYGQLKMHIDSTSSGGQSMSTSGSRLGFKGSEDLGNGMKAIFKLEFGLNFDDPGQSTSTSTIAALDPTDTTVSTTVTLSNTSGDSAGITSRSQYVGLSGNFGTVMFGKRETNYLLTTAKMDLFADTMADYNNILGFDDNSTFTSAAGGARPNNAIHYVSPSFSGLSAAVGVYGDDTDLNGTGYDVALMYSNGGINASIAHVENEATNADDTRIGLGYKMDALYVGLVYEDKNGTDIWAISGSYKMGNNTLKATVGDNEADGNAWAIGVDHAMSKRTKVYALYADSDRALNSENAGNNSGFSLGMQHNF